MNFVPYAPLLSLSMTITADWVLLMMSCVPCMLQWQSWWWQWYRTIEWLNTLLSSCDNIIRSCCYLSSHMFWVLWHVRMWVCCICVGICMHAMYESHYSAIYVSSESQNVQNAPLYGNPAINTQWSVQGILPTGMNLVVVLGGWVSKMGIVMYCQRWVYVLRSAWTDYTLGLCCGYIDQGVTCPYSWIACLWVAPALVTMFNCSC